MFAMWQHPQTPLCKKKRPKGKRQRHREKFGRPRVKFLPPAVPAAYQRQAGAHTKKGQKCLGRMSHFFAGARRTQRCGPGEGPNEGLKKGGREKQVNSSFVESSPVMLRRWRMWLVLVRGRFVSQVAYK